MRVFHQNRGALCGFHSFYNAKCYVRALLAQNNADRSRELVNSTLMTK